MDRLTTLLTTCLLLGSASVAEAQTLQLTVAGDVQDPVTLELQGEAAGQPIFLRDLLDKAGIQGDGSAVVLRADYYQSGGSEFVSSEMAGRGSQLSHGDIVVFHQTSGTQTSSGHIVLVVDRTPRIMPLADISGRLANLLGALNLTFDAADQIPVVRTQMGAPALRSMIPSDALAHGDVVLLNQVARVDPEHVSRVFVHASGQAVTSSPPVHVAADERIVDSSTSSPPAMGLTLPDSNPVVDVAAEEAAVTGPELPSEATIERPAAAEDAAMSPELLAAVAPTAAEEAVSPIWNGVFICGLLGSLTLILTGWLKTRHENRRMQEQSTEAAKTLQTPQEIKPAPSMDTSWRTVHEIPSSSFMTGDLTAEELPMTAADLSGISGLNKSAADRLVDDQEWIGSDWRPEDRSDVVPLQSPAASAPPVPVAPKPPVPAAPPMDIPVTHPQPAAEPEPSPIEAADVLEDLIQNRIPMQLQQADLPMRVTLFGRPAGPRRLRIDAAHTQIAPPKFAAGNRAGRGASAAARAGAVTSGTGADEAASLDRALNSLHEQDHG